MPESLNKDFDDKFIATINSFAKPKLSVFTSHNSKDENIAEALSNLIEKAYSLAPSSIICTSVQGHRLPLSANTNDTLLRLIFEAKVFICIATENSLGCQAVSGSFYVAVELGARWGMKRYLAVMLAAGATGSVLKAPFNVLNALNCEDRGQVQQFIEQIGDILDRLPLESSAYISLIDKLVEVSKQATKAN